VYLYIATVVQFLPHAYPYHHCGMTENARLEYVGTTVIVPINDQRRDGFLTTLYKNFNKPIEPTTDIRQTMQ